ncbi:hypothetical protein NIES4071_19810 [Calothrix sp. NIES-4071]|nr:hypothetical protein NIES4071_19810 [Calothrix sp. NIES-4071]BAZ56314.1 hypothetical protein NIES4105_19760 [Calothrix sp. NIES-4105]
MNLLEIEIYTDRLLLKPIAMQYKSEIFKEFTTEITTYMMPRPANDVFETESFINESVKGLNQGSNLQLVIIKKRYTRVFRLHWNPQRKYENTGTWNLAKKIRTWQLLRN